jgi:hypothetical protein
MLEIDYNSLNKLKTLILNGLRFQIDITNDKLRIYEIVRMKDEYMTMTREELNKLFLEVKSDIDYYSKLYQENFIMFKIRYSIDSYKDIEACRSNNDGYNILVIDYHKHSHTPCIQIVMNRKTTVCSLLDEKEIEIGFIDSSLMNEFKIE